ncbi:MAG: hypothetical protein OEV40_27675 [Acidimicrobiia bacterium]|nr:hypothetical protein [Acidimicrobiia bacterium]
MSVDDWTVDDWTIDDWSVDAVVLGVDVRSAVAVSLDSSLEQAETTRVAAATVRSSRRAKDTASFNGLDVERDK